MAKTIKITGIVLSSMEIGEYDKRIVLLTKEKGKITAFIKGVRKQGSPLLIASQVFAFGEFLIYQTRNSISILQADIKNSFHNLRYDIEKLSYAMYFNELIDFISNEEEESLELLILLYKTLYILEKDTANYLLIRCIFELKAISLIGLGPEVTKCIKYQKDICDNITFFSASQGGVFCKKHGSIIKDCIKITEGTRYTMQYILASPIKDLYNFRVSDKIQYELIQIIDKFRQIHLDKKFNSLEFINNIL